MLLTVLFSWWQAEVTVELTSSTPTQGTVAAKSCARRCQCRVVDHVVLT